LAATAAAPRISSAVRGYDAFERFELELVLDELAGAAEAFGRFELELMLDELAGAAEAFGRFELELVLDELAGAAEAFGSFELELVLDDLAGAAEAFGRFELVASSGSGMLLTVCQGPPSFADRQRSRTSSSSRPSETASASPSTRPWQISRPADTCTVLRPFGVGQCT
jgi:hypothetical protein